MISGHSGPGRVKRPSPRGERITSPRAGHPAAASRRRPGIRYILALILVLTAGTATSGKSWAESPSLPWQKWDPALFDRYEIWGWPATVVLDRDGNEIFKRRGYIPPELFGKLLAAVIEDPSALPTFAVGAAVRPEAVAGAAGTSRSFRREAVSVRNCRRSTDQG